MLLYSFQELLLLCAAAIVIDWVVGDPKWPTHPVIWIGRIITRLERLLASERYKNEPLKVKLLGIILTTITITSSWFIIWLIVWLADMVHPWLGYTVSAWFISTTIAIKGLKDAAMLVYIPLVSGDMADARKYVGYIVGRDTNDLSESEAVRATVETVAENTVDAFVAPILFGLLGGAPLAMLYRATNTLDSMVGYRNDKYIYFGWCSARSDDVLNYIPARITGALIVLIVWLTPRLNSDKSIRAIRTFAHLHPSPNSGIPESAVAGALGIELGGINTYFGVKSERARMGWATRAIRPSDIKATITIMYGVSVILLVGVMITWFFIK
ncbi:cobalamin biosynthesis protein CobD [Paenibacillus sp. GSMTC-2017]|uniref:adenosylcobinamide-phosphate synthase CbiB n=1 Tax=Paenibacillus sp. GSMTC-2017 TaxID=2794350 RepID=UPI0018D8EE98|nr:adenosylcobinamide-phosphate synthase CbiB [Paenibacillus sp. GSMTC-2017]MBH5316496.1 cobalamin biosynthesis protein CobD [Paenibacillus sp. GSMTC-2017]